MKDSHRANPRINWLVRSVQQVLLSSVLLLTSVTAQAQMTPDGTLGGESSRVVPRSLGGELIEGGAIRGSNLFHSFSEFNVGNQRPVYFANPTGIQNILTRVTGGTLSNIDGTLGVDGAANLFLINPNGIIFGQNARLDVRGSFVGSTANAIGFGTQGDFSATNPQTPSLLTVQPSALLFTQLNPGKISSNSISPVGKSPDGIDLFGLRVPDGQSLLLIGGDVQIDGNGASGGVHALGGRIELGGFANSGVIGLDPQFRLTFSDAVPRSNLALTNTAQVRVRGNGAGDIALNANMIAATNGGRFVAGTEGAGDAGNITVNANVVNLSGQRSGFVNQARENATGNGGNITLSTNELNISSEASLNTRVFGRGKGGNTIINARDSVTLDNGFLFADVSPNANTQGGSIQMNTGSLLMTNRGQIDASLEGQGSAGNIQIRARTVTIDGSSSDEVRAAIVNNVGSQGVGQGGNLEIRADSLTLTNGAQLVSNILGRGDGGAIAIEARKILFQGRPGNADGSFNPSGIFGGVDRTGIGNAGDIRITADSLSIVDDATITNFTRGQGNAGNISIDARDRLELINRSDISSNVTPTGVGNAGSVQIRTGVLSLIDEPGIDSSTDGIGNAGTILIDANALVMGRTRPATVPYSGVISTQTSRQGNAGNIILNVRDTISLDNGLIRSGVLDSGNSSKATFRGRGQSGEIRITTGSLKLLNDAQLRTSSTGVGNAGNIFIKARDSITLDNRGSIETSISSFRGSPGIGNAGNLEIDTRSLFVTNGGYIFAFTTAQGNSGNVNIRASNQVVVDSGSNNPFTLISTAVLPGGTGQGGDIRVTTRSLSLTNNASLFTASNEQGNSGNVFIQASDQISLTNGATIATNTAGQGDAGKITLQTGKLLMSGIGEGGNKNGISSAVLRNVSGRGGDVDIIANSISMSDGSFFLTTTSGQGRAGNFTIKARDRIALFSSSIFTGSLGTGQSGDIDLQTKVFTLNQSFVTTENSSTNGGNITLKVDALSMRLGSLISTNAGTRQTGGNGGNITINAGSIVAPAKDNSDITANAFAGRGGNVSISAKAIFGIQARSQQTPESDITASSRLGVQGSITIDQPNVQPTQGVNELPKDIIDASNQMAQVCPRNSELAKMGKFVVSGTGSLPPNPIEPLTGSTPIPLATIEGSPNATIATIPTEPKIVEAQGWIRENGKVRLVAAATPSSISTPAICPTPQPN